MTFQFQVLHMAWVKIWDTAIPKLDQYFWDFCVAQEKRKLCYNVHKTTRTLMISLVVNPMRITLP